MSRVLFATLLMYSSMTGLWIIRLYNFTTKSFLRQMPCTCIMQASGCQQDV